MLAKILLIDDDDSLRRMVAQHLRVRGHAITEATHGAEALEILRSESISLIVLDYNMPVMDGLAFLATLRTKMESEIPVLMMSGNADSELRAKCYALGVYDFVAKPESADILAARVANGLKISELLEFRRATKNDRRLSAAILNTIAVPNEVVTPQFCLRSFSRNIDDVGGDLCLAYGTDTDRPVFIILDIAGHGMSAAFFSLFVSVAARRAWRETLSPQKILTRLNRELKEYLPPGYFVTMLCCEFDIRKRAIHFANAGHPPPLFWNAGRISQLVAARQPPLGLRSHQEYSQESFPFENGDFFAAFTDGAVHVSYPDDTPLDFTISELAMQGATAEEIFHHATTSLKANKGLNDDHTIMVLSAPRGA